MIYEPSINALLSLLRPNQDNSDLEKEISKCFKSFSYFVDAPILELTRFGFTTNEILFIKSISHTVECYLDTKQTYLETAQEAAQYLTAKIGFKEKEWNACIYLNQKNKILKFEKNTMYDRASCYQQFDKILLNCIKTGATKIINSHNHPNGYLIPSDADISVHEYLCEYCNENEIEFVDDIIVGVNGYYSFLEEEIGESSYV